MNSSRIKTITACIAAVAHTHSVAKTIIRTTIVVALVTLTMVGNGSLYAQEARPDDLTYEKYSTGWAFYLDNDALTTGDSDEDYTGGFAVTLSGRRATEYLISLDGWLNGLDRFSRFENLYKDTNYFQRHSFEYGATLFTPQRYLY